MSVRDYIVDSLVHSWIGISRTNGLRSLRFGRNVTVRDVKIRSAHGFTDVSDVMRPAGLYPLQSMRHSSELCSVPRTSERIDLDHYGEASGCARLHMVLEMLHGRSRMNQVDLREAECSSHCHKTVKRRGLAGIGSARRTREFTEYCGRIFLQAFSDRSHRALGREVLPDGLGDYVQIGRGTFGVVIGVPCVRVIKPGGRWLDLRPSARSSTFCVSIVTKLAPIMLRA